MQAVLCGYYGMGNGGDEALLATLLQMLPKSVTPIVLSGNPDQTRRRYGVQAVPRKSGFDVLKTLSKADAFIWGGGSLMQDATSAMNPIYYGGLMGLAQGLGLKTVAWAQGIGPLQRSPTQWITRRTFSNCTTVSVRDGKSGKWLNQQHINNFILAPDPVWALDAKPINGADPLPKPRIAVVLRDHHTLTQTRLTAIAQALRHLQLATQASILLIPFQPVVDRPIADHIAQHLSGSYRILQTENPSQLKGDFSTGELDLSHATPRSDHGSGRRIPLFCPELRSQGASAGRGVRDSSVGFDRRSSRSSNSRRSRNPGANLAGGFFGQSGIIAD